MKIHITASCIAIGLALLLQLSTISLCIIILCSAFVIYAELLNSALESLLDILHPRVSLQLRSLKDMLAGSVLVVSVAAFVIGCILFTQPIAQYIAQALQ